MDLLNNFWQLFLLSAPWLMLGLLIAGLLNVYLPANFLNKHLGKEGFWTTVKAALIGAPMPLCSCGVIPAAIGLRRAGASKSATTAFLVSTPETGVDSVSVSYVLLGPFMAIIRPIAAISSAIVAGVLVGRDALKSDYKDEHANLSQQKTTRCCSTDEVEIATASCCTSEKLPLAAEESCSSNEKQQPSKTACCSDVKPETTKSPSCCASDHREKPTQWQKVEQAITFSCNKLLSDTMVWLMIGLFFAALVQTYVPESFLTQWGSGILAMTVVILISIPMYICATASTPIAAGLLLSGVAPGAVLVFMLAGPATNIATLGVVAKELGKRAVFAYLTSVVGVAIAFGFLTDFLVAEFGFVVSPLLGEEHEILPYWFSMICGLILMALMLRLVIIAVRAKAVTTGKSIA
ncbi:SO_0444 family Cu/Zn efflux transporter [Pseudoalteromonas sp. ZZD1]|uniref:SO_0444 family Cu/Zn efflux transporter n=1 Tax=Pseudoalteromonas sp. ZZD1 TaxID=3139395 RepID=UPI003BAAE0F2